MNKFDKICAVMTILVGVVFMILGVIGIFAGSSANFTLPPVLGVIPFFLGWAMCVTLIKFWKSNNTSSSEFITSAKFMDFLNQHPEFRAGPMKLQWAAFHQWLYYPHSYTGLIV